jgi:hypothetical protein
MTVEAPDNLAGTVAACPRCSSLVGVPNLAPTAPPEEEEPIEVYAAPSRPKRSPPVEEEPIDVEFADEEPMDVLPADRRRRPRKRPRRRRYDPDLDDDRSSAWSDFWTWTRIRGCIFAILGAAMVATCLSIDASIKEAYLMGLYTTLFSGIFFVVVGVYAFLRG